MSCQGCLFPTTIGTCGIVWSDAGIRAVQLPETSDAALLKRLRRKASPLTLGEVPEEIGALLRRIQGHLEGDSDRRGFADLKLDLEDAPPFTRKAYLTARRAVGPGRTTTYGALARRCGSPGAARAVGQAMAHNPTPIIVPCHRVLGAGGQLGGFSAHGGVATKLRMLTVEGADLTRIARGGVAALRDRDPQLRALIKKVGAFRLAQGKRADAFATLAASIVHQQLSLKAGATIYRRLAQLVGDPPAPARVQATSPAKLRSVGVSAQKARYLSDLARLTLDGSLGLDQLERTDDETVVQQLTRVKGIGRWSAEMFLIFHLGRLDVLPVDDQGLRRAIQLAYRMRRLPDAARIRRLARRWVPFRSVACWYLWRGLDSGGLA